MPTDEREGRTDRLTVAIRSGRVSAGVDLRAKEIGLDLR